MVQTIMRQLFTIIKLGSNWANWDHQLAIAPNLATTSFRCLALKCVFASLFQRSVANPLSYQITMHTGLLKPGYGAMPHGMSRARGQFQFPEDRFLTPTR
jgi:hypothetical protein